MNLLPIVGAILLLLVIGPTPVLADTSTGRTDLDGVKVAIWGETTNMVVSSGIALYAMFEWMNATVEWIYGEDVKAGDLSGFDILAMPGGQISSYYNALDDSGMENIRQWIADGGSYFGICGGALLAAASRRFGIYNGSYSLVVPGDYFSLAVVEMNVNTTCDGPKLSDLPATFQTLYWGSSYFIPDEGFDYIPLARYAEGNGPGMIAFEYQQGNAFLSSPHPEYEEESARDGTDEFDEYTDLDSEWEFLLRVAVWQVESSMPDESQADIMLFGLVAIGLAAVVVVVIAVLRKR